ncbi:MAG: ATP-binding protein [Actinomycetes bacterium]
MRRRLVLSTLAVAVVAVVLLGLPLAIAGALLIQDRAQQALLHEAEQVAAAVDRSASSGQAFAVDDLASLVTPGTAVKVVLPNGRTIRTGPTSTGAVLRVTYRSATDALVTARQDRSAVDQDVQRAVLLVLTVSIVAVGAAVALGLVQARRLSAPLVELVTTAERLGSGESRLSAQASGIPEVDRVSEELERSAGRLATMLAREREFASDASHQLRTPLTALSMRLEEISGSDDLVHVREEARIALAQVERLADVVDRLLATVRQRKTETSWPMLVDAVVGQQVQEWRPAFAARGRPIVVGGTTGLRVLATPGGVAQVLATLLENSLVHGGGTVTVRTRSTGSLVVIEVGDQGPGVPPGLVGRIFERSVSGGHGTGLGLALARDLAAADNGRLELVSTTPAVFALFLSAAGEPIPRGETRAVRPAR